MDLLKGTDEKLYEDAARWMMAKRWMVEHSCNICLEYLEDPDEFDGLCRDCYKQECQGSIREASMFDDREVTNGD